MNSTGVAMLWCALQVTLVSLAAAIFCGLLRKRLRSAQGSVLATSVLLILGLSLLAFSPWPQWRWYEAPKVASAADTIPSPVELPERPTVAADVAPAKGSSEMLRDFATAFLAELQTVPPSSPASGWSWQSILAAIALG